MWLCAQLRMWKADFMSVVTAPGKVHVECPICAHVKTAGKYMCNAKHCICGGTVHDSCISEYVGALCECNLPQALVNRFKN